MERRRLEVVLALTALVAVALVGLVLRAEAAGPHLLPTGLQLPWSTKAVFDLARRVCTPLGVLVSALVLAGFAAGPTLLGRPARLAPLVLVTAGALLLAIAGVLLVTWWPDPRPIEPGELAMCANAVFDPRWVPGTILLEILLATGGMALVLWMAVGWQELGRPRGSTAEEVGRVLFASAPVLLAVHALLGDTLAGFTPETFGLPAGVADVGAFTATGCVLLGVGLVRILRRGPASAPEPAGG